MKNSKNNFQEDPIRLPYFDWDKTKFFYYIAKLGSLSEAGKFLNISQSSLSRKISILEDNLKCKLFTRTPKGLELTRKGDELFEIIESIFLQLKGFSYNAAVVANKGKKRKIRIATSHALAAYVFHNLIMDYNKIHPEILFELIGEDRLLDVIFNDVDITIHPIDTNSPKTQGVHQEYLFSLEKRLYASREYLEIYGEPQSVEDLSHHRLIAFGHSEQHPYADVNWILKLGMSGENLHEPIFTTNSVECMIEAAKNSIGIVGSYPEIKLIKDSALINVLPHVRDRAIQEYLFYPNYLKKDDQIIDIVSYFKSRLAK